MKKSWNGPPSKKIDPVVSTWWRDRVTFLIKEGRKRDAAALFLEFCFPGSRAIELSAHPHPD